MRTTEKKVSHTPGPWSIVLNDDGTPELGGGMDQYTTVFSESGFGSIAQVIYKKTNILGDSKLLEQKTFEANAKLVAAAPELLFQVQQAKIIIEVIDPDNPAIQQMETVIKKATE